MTVLEGNETIAQDIGEIAMYKWYDNEGNLLHEGREYQVLSDRNKQLTLEVTATADGYKDYDKVSVN